MIFQALYTGVLVVMALIVQSHESFDVIRIAGVKPDLVFIIIAYVAYSFGSFFGEVSGFAGGLLHDAVSNAPLGLLTFPKVATGLLIGLFGRSVIKSNSLTIVLLIFIASLVKGIITVFFCYVFHPSLAASFLGVILPESFYNALAALPLFMICDRIYQRELEREGLL